MRQKRAKSYRKQLQYLRLNFKFREPYQILLDDQIILEAVRTKQDLHKTLERTVQGQIKLMVTQCCMEALYKSNDQEAIDLAKSFERRKCGHFPMTAEQLSKKKKFDEEEEQKAKSEKENEEEPEKDDKKKKSKSKKDADKDIPPPNATKTPSACLWTVVAADKTTNKHRYFVGTQDFRLRARLRTVPAVPLLYLNRSVMVMEPMSDVTTKMRDSIEDAKLTGGLNRTGGSVTVTATKRKAVEDGGSEEDGEAVAEEPPKKKKKGPKAPHPLSVLKKKKKPVVKQQPVEKEQGESAAPAEKKKRRRTHHKSSAGGEETPTATATAGNDDN